MFLHVFKPLNWGVPKNIAKCCTIQCSFETISGTTKPKCECVKRSFWWRKPKHYHPCSLGWNGAAFKGQTFETWNHLFPSLTHYLLGNLKPSVSLQNPEGLILGWMRAPAVQSSATYISCFDKIFEMVPHKVKHLIVFQSWQSWINPVRTE